MTEKEKEKEKQGVRSEGRRGERRKRKGDVDIEN